ncbi:MAG TPA: YigZ family protein [Candidatus Nitrosocosmicus sp.]|nr:YigZ family protein [Candidatus Nitrosocosmicus sp.]
MAAGYRMLKKYADTYFIEKKSKFISYVQPVYSEEEAVQFLSTIRKKHYDATHNCYAYTLGESMNIQRSSDDGEPSGTAGIPILEVLRKEELTNSIVIVTRYFGGIMLGAGGLIRAYTEGAASGIKAAGTVRVQPFSVHQLKLDYGFLSKLQYEMPKRDYMIESVDYLENVTMRVFTAPELSGAFIEDIAQWTNGAVTVEPLGEQLLKVDEVSGDILK